jgi:hypothetical protein
MANNITFLNFSNLFYNQGLNHTSMAQQQSSPYNPIRDARVARDKLTAWLGATSKNFTAATEFLLKLDASLKEDEKSEVDGKLNVKYCLISYNFFVT